MNNNLYRALISLACLIPGACSKKTNTGALNPTSLAGTYLITAITIKSGQGPETSVMNDSLTLCQRDNLYVLNADHTLNYIDAGTACTGSSGWDDVWALENKDTRINLGGKDFAISRFDGPALVLTQTGSNNGIAYVLTTVFTKRI